jgi:hypothetical protein
MRSAGYVNAQQLFLSSLIAPLRGGAIHGFTHAREYPVLLGFATERLRPRPKRSPLLPVGVRR